MSSTTLNPADIKAAVDAALAEDIGAGDITTKAVIPDETRLNLVMATRQDIVVAGLPVALEVFRRLAPDAVVQVETTDGARVRTADLRGKKHFVLFTGLSHDRHAERRLVVFAGQGLTEQKGFLPIGHLVIADLPAGKRTGAGIIV